MSFIFWTDKAGALKTLYFDVTLSEAPEFRSNVTEHPVEKGADVTDHVRAQPTTVKLEVFVSQTPTRDVNARGGAFSSLELDLKTKKETASTYQFGTEFDAVSDTLSILNDLRTSATLVTLVTSPQDYENMIISEVMPKRDPSTGRSAGFSITLRQIRTVETKLVKAPTPKETRGKKAVARGAQDPVTASDQTKKKTILASLFDRFK